MDASLSSTVLGFRLDVLCEENRSVSWDVDGSWSIDNVKAKIQEIEGTAVSQQKLFYEGEEIRRGDYCLFDLKSMWSESDVVLKIQMKVEWRLPCRSTFERDEGRSRSRTRSPVPSDSGNENCIF